MAIAAVLEGWCFRNLISSSAIGSAAANQLAVEADGPYATRQEVSRYSEPAAASGRDVVPTE